MQTQNAYACGVEGHIVDVNIRPLGLCISSDNIDLPLPLINTWGSNESSIWVAFGCKAEFEVSYRPFK